MDIDEARTLAERYLSEFSTPDRPLALFGDDMVQDHEWCFVFPWNTARYVETLDFADSIGPGTGPVVVVKATEDTWMMGSARSPERQLADYAREHGFAR